MGVMPQPNSNENMEVNVCYVSYSKCNADNLICNKSHRNNLIKKSTKSCLIALGIIFN